MPAILLFSIWDTRTPSGETFSFISVPICAFSSSSVMPGEGTNGMLPYEHTTHWKTTIKSWQGKKEEEKKKAWAQSVAVKTDQGVLPNTKET